ncbi:MAG: hypothetical protein MMC33_008686 [Icmadophila ericetorum]|nr:hypothetical protein [Icmadophila ericetorum]
MLLPKLKEKPISQIVIVDHSGGYDSVDGFILAFGDIVRAGTPGNPEKAGDPTKIKMVLINVINEKRKPSGKSPIEDPKMAAILARFYPPGEKMLNNIVGDAKDAANALEKQIIRYCEKNGGLVDDSEPSSSSSKHKKKKKLSPF